MKHLGTAIAIMKKNRMAKGGEPKLGSGKRFAKLESSLSHKPGIKDPKALAAAIGRKKYGDKKMDSMAEAHMADGGEVMCAHGGPVMCASGCYAEGGEAMPMDNDDFLSEDMESNANDFTANDDFLSDDADNQMAIEDPKMKRRGILQKILES